MAYTYEDLSTMENASSQYFWTCRVFEQNKKSAEYIEITTTEKAVYSDFKVLYAFRIWKNDGTTLKRLYDGDGVSLAILSSWATSVAADLEIGDIIQGSTAKNNGLNLPFSKVYGDNDTQDSKEVFYFTVKAKKSNVTFTPKILIKLKKNSTENSSTTQDKEVLPFTTASGTGIDTGLMPIFSKDAFIPTIKFTKARAQGEIPAQVKSAAWRAEYITLDKCSTPNQWVAIVNLPDVNPLLRNYCLRRWSLDGLSSTTPPETGGSAYGQDQFIAYDYDTTKPENVNKKPTGAPQKAIKALIAIKANTCGESVDATTEEGDPSDFWSSKPVAVEVDRTNPPNHFYTRDISFWQKIREKAIGDITGTTPADIQRKDILLSDSLPTGKLGMIFQDESSANALNRSDNKAKPWGFRFTYNPNSLSYSTAMDTSIDWMMSTKDPANYIGGNVGVSFQLYLNRIADMTELASLKKNPREYTTNYPRKLSAEHVAGILNRGTEYDLEYLYRVVNGDPVKSENGLLTYTIGGEAAKTSDFGYITGTPIWFKLHDNLRYKGSIASISVTHILFNEYMIPMLSLVDVQMIRYPIVGDTSQEVQDAFDKKKKDYTAAKNAADAAAANPSNATQTGKTS